MEVLVTVKFIVEVEDTAKIENLFVDLDMKRVSFSEEDGKISRKVEGRVLAYTTEKSTLNK